MEKKRLQVWAPFFIALAMAAGIFIGYRMRDAMPGKPFFYVEKRRPVQEILDLVSRNYVDEIDVNQLADSAIEAVLSRLDPHSSYIPAKDVQAANEDLQGSFYGIGIEFDILLDTLHVIGVLDDGPARKAGVKVGDRFLTANGKKISGVALTVDSIRNQLRGERGTPLKVKLLRGGKLLELTIVRNNIPVSSIDASYLLDKQTGYIRINKFSTQTYREFMEALISLQEKGTSRLVLDLRGNGGGVLEEAVEIVDEFLEGDKLITYTEGKNVPRKEFRCRREGRFEKGDLVVLCDEGSASASEIVMGALQDWDRATIVGRRSFGKGLVQEQFDLSDRSAIRLTVARYFTPSGRSIQRPYSNGGKAYYEEITNRILGTHTGTDSQPKYDSAQVFVTPRGKKVYGGGGINPDEFVAADTSRISATVSRLFARSVINHFAYRYMLDNPGIQSKYSTPSSFAASFEVTPPVWQSFTQFAASDSVSTEGLGADETDFLKRYIKASIARQFWRNEGYYEAYNGKDPTIIRALYVLNKKEPSEESSFK